ncbi:MAG: zinc-ribbon domain-containing protein, partial [Bdellovibrionales bacterium]|nr:zinc-ribbon domain-containing protein [Bdellovibrionales bacterium]
MIIGCPSCQTKFAVDAQQLAEVENPRFHCSRCGHVFDLNDARRAEEALSAVDVAAPSPAFSSDQAVAATDEEPTQEFEPPVIDEEETEDSALLSGSGQVGSGLARSPSAAFLFDESQLEEDDEPDAEQLELLPDQEEQDFEKRFSLTEASNDRRKLLDDEEEQAAIRATWPSGAGEEPYEVDFSERRSVTSQASSVLQTSSADAIDAEIIDEDEMPGTAQWASLRDAEDLYEVDPTEHPQHEYMSRPSAAATTQASSPRAANPGAMSSPSLKPTSGEPTSGEPTSGSLGHRVTGTSAKATAIPTDASPSGALSKGKMTTKTTIKPVGEDDDDWSGGFSWAKAFDATEESEVQRPPKVSARAGGVEQQQPSLSSLLGEPEEEVPAAQAFEQTTSSGAPSFGVEWNEPYPEQGPAGDSSVEWDEPQFERSVREAQRTSSEPERVSD